MGHIKVPKGVDLIIGPSVLSEQDRKMIVDIFAIYKRTGKMPYQRKSDIKKSTRTTKEKEIT
jgi:hypothetical protein